MNDTMDEGCCSGLLYRRADSVERGRHLVAVTDLEDGDRVFPVRGEQWKHLSRYDDSISAQSSASLEESSHQCL